MSTERRIKARRRIAMRLGLLAILVATASACIFDRSEYKGGGRNDKGATAATASGSATTDEDDEDDDDPPSERDAASVFDSGAGGG